MKDKVLKLNDLTELYGFIANNYYAMSKEELKEVILALISNNELMDLKGLFDDLEEFL